MPMKTAKAFFEVTAGIIPGTAMPEYCKRWNYTSDEYQQDTKVPADQQTNLQHAADGGAQLRDEPDEPRLR